MKKLIITSIIISFSTCLSAQTEENPFAKHGFKKIDTYTSSKGEFAEFHDNKDVVEIGSVLFDTKTNQVVGYLSEEELEKEVVAQAPIMSIDPLCEKYYWISPYAYCMNNPVRYTDPTGKWVAGSDGKPVTYSLENGWSKNTTKDVIRIGNAMMKTETGTTQLNALIGHSSEISMKISNKIIETEDGLKMLGNTELSGAKIENGKINVEKFSITIYEKAINEGDVDFKNLRISEAIGAVSTHEAGHTNPTNVKQLYSNAIEGTNFDTEKMPMELEKKYIEEINNKNQ